MKTLLISLINSTLAHLGGAVVAYSNDTDTVNYWKPQVIVGTASEEFTPTKYSVFSGYTFTSPNFAVKYTGDTITSLKGALSHQTGLTSIDKWTVDTSKVTNMDDIFWNCKSLASLDLSSFDTSKVTNMSAMFYNCFSLASLDVNSFDTSAVIYMYSMISCCNSLTSLNLSNFDTSKVTNMGWMFLYCTSLTTLNISSFNFSAVTNVTDMFDGCSSLADLQFGTNLKLSLDLCNSPLTHTSALSVLNGLATITTTQTITFKTSTYSTLTAAEIKTATDKGWTITSA